MNGSAQRSRTTRGSKTALSFVEPVPGDEEEESAGSASESVYSDEEEYEDEVEDEESSYESDLVSSKQSNAATFNIAKKESNRVRVWRAVLSGMLIVTAVVVIVTTYVFLTDNEENEFQSTFNQAALTISDAMRFNYNKVIDGLMSRSDAVTSLVLTSGYQWPFVTIPHFDIRGERAREETLSETYGFAPIVKTEDRVQWELYSVYMQNWILEGRGVDIDNPDNAAYLPTTAIIPREITYVDSNTSTETLKPYPQVLTPSQEEDTPFAVNWQMSPIPALTYTINLNMRSSEHYRHLVQVLLDTSQPVLSDFTDLGDAYYETVLPAEQHQQLHESYVGTNEGRFFAAKDRPHSILMAPIFDTFFNATKEVVGLLWVVLPWDWQLSGLLPEGTKPVDVVLDNSCGSTYSYQVSGPNAIFLGPGDLHETEFEDWVVTSAFAMQPIVMPYDPTNTQMGGAKVSLNGNNYTLCEYRVKIYPTKEMNADYDTGRPETFAIIMAAIFMVTGMVFLIFVRYVQQRQDMVMATAIRTSAIVSSLFPANVRERIMKDAEEQGRMDMMGGKGRGGNWRLGADKGGAGPKSKLEDFIGVEAGGGGGLGELGGEHDAFKSKPIADLFPDATVLFADLVGFTAWSSEREPTQVFQLLETLYHAYDQIARKRRVFKVETIGDCYVAVTGLPEPRKDHATAMARFARDCMQKMKVLVVKLEVPLGPGTADLSMRFGLHSGPVTAGVLRGEKSRFQLFGDTVNTAARMESNGAKERIHVSQETADEINKANKSHWLTAREDKIHAKGKGELQTYWLEIRRDSNAIGDSAGSDNESESSDYSDFTDGASSLEDADGEIVLDERSQRLVDWVVEQLSRLLKQILARRKLLGIPANPEIAQQQVLDFSEGGTVIDEVRDLVKLVPYNPEAANLEETLASIELSPEVVSQLRDFVATIATLHNDNQFHNLSHATHVTMSVVKLLSRIIAADDPRKQYTSGDGSDDSDMDQDAIDLRLHEQSYGIRNDPLAQFSVVFSALIHDVDHPGVTNAELIKEGAKVAETYNGKSISEQNSVDLAWYLFMDDRYCDLRGCIYHDDAELHRFRQLIVNAVIATDIADKNLKILRDERWESAFGEGSTEGNQEILNRKATVMIDCLLQASDIAHTMQHWHIYRKWNEFLFRELHVAFQQGRCAKNPVDFWYDGEIGFFDFYIIPLAKKLADCGVFGVSSDEYLNYATKNRNEWQARGKEIVKEYIENLKDLEVDNKVDEASAASSFLDEPPPESKQPTPRRSSTNGNRRKSTA